MYARARAIAAQLTEALAALPSEHDGHGIRVTLDPAEVPSRARGGVALLVQPPDLTVIGHDAGREWQWTLVLTCGPAGDYLASWERLSRALDALITAAPVIDRGTAASFDLPGGAQALPAYLLTLTDTTTE